jgi:hypothetical protein
MRTQEQRPPVLGELASDRGDSIDYRDPHSVNYLDHSHLRRDALLDLVFIREIRLIRGRVFSLRGLDHGQREGMVR